MKNSYKQGTLVEYRLNGDHTQVGYGKIVGLATNGVTLLGKTYIIEPGKQLDNETYPYTHFVLPEIWFNAIGETSNDINKD